MIDYAPPTSSVRKIVTNDSHHFLNVYQTYIKALTLQSLCEISSEWFPNHYNLQVKLVFID